jgi:hypothetical protein
LPDREGLYGTASLNVPASECSPRVWISGQVVRRGLGWPDPSTPSGDTDVSGTRFLVHATGGSVLYLLGDYDSGSDTYSAQWPD